MTGELYTIQDLVRSISVHINTDSRFKHFQRMYKNDRIAFIYDIMPDLGRTITAYQIDILGLFDSGYSRVAVRSPHGAGKTTLASVMVHHSVLTAEEDCKVPTTASAWRQLEKYLWPEIRKSARMINWDKVGREPYDNRTEFLKLSIRMREGTIEAFALSSDDHQTIEGAHATRLVYIFDEAKAIPRDTWDAAEGAFANANILVPAGIEDAILNIDNSPDDYDNSTIIEGKLIEPIIESPSMKGIAAYEVGKGRKSNKGIDKGNYVGINELHNKRDNSKDKAIHVYAGGNGREREQGIVDESDSREIATTSALALPTSNSLIVQNPRKSINWQSHRNTKADKIRTNLAYMQKVVTYEAIALAISTPGNPSGQFYDIMSKKSGYEHWQTKHITLEEAIIAGRISSSWAQQMKKQWGEYSSQYQNRVEGNFAIESEETVIPLTWIEQAVDRWYNWKKHGQREISGIRTLGVDVARLGTDKTVVAVRSLSVVENIHSFSRLRTTETSGRVLALAANRKVKIEMDGGLGAAVYDMLRENDSVRNNLVPITVSAKTAWRDKSGQLSFFNVRSAMWWNMRELLDPEQGEEICLPDVDELIGDLSAPKWEMLKDAVVKMESKKDIISRIGRSTDYGDAVCLAFWEGKSGGGVVF